MIWVFRLCGGNDLRQQMVSTTKCAGIAVAAAQGGAAPYTERSDANQPGHLNVRAVYHTGHTLPSREYRSALFQRDIDKAAHKMQTAFLFSRLPPNLRSAEPHITMQWAIRHLPSIFLSIFPFIFGFAISCFILLNGKQNSSCY